MAQPNIVVLPSSHGALEPFDPNGVLTVDQYESIFQNFCRANHIPEEPTTPEGHYFQDPNRRRSLFLSTVGHKAFAVIHAALLPGLPEHFPIPLLVSLLKNRYEPEGLVDAHRVTFEQRVQKPQEPVFDFICALQQLAVPCAFGEYREDALRTRLICGLRSEAMRQVLMTSPNLNWAQAKDKVIQLEAVERQSRAMALVTPVNATAVGSVRRPQRQQQYGPRPFAPRGWAYQGMRSPQPRQPAPRGAWGPRGSQQQQPRQQQPRSRAPQQTSTFPCFRCGRQEHDQSVCPAKYWQCYKCGNYGHMAKFCTVEQNVNAMQEQENWEEFVTQEWEEQNGNEEQSNEQTDNLEEQFQAFSVNKIMVEPMTRDDEVFSVNMVKIISCEEVPNQMESSINIVSVNNIAASPPLCLPVQINGMNISMEVDTGSGVSLMTNKQFENSLQTQLQSSSVKLTTISSAIRVKGEVLVKVGGVKDQKVHTVRLIVCNSDINFVPLLGRDWLDVLFPVWKDYFQSKLKQAMCVNKNTSDPLALFKVKFPRVFAEEDQSAIVGFEVSLKLKDNAVPVFVGKPYSIPYALVEPVEEKIKGFLDSGKAVEVAYSKWASPALPIPKKDGGIRVCFDFKRTINTALQVDVHPLPKPEDIFASLADGEYFCVIDLADAYTQLKVDKQSRELLTIITHKGLIQFNRLIYGVASAPALFQNVMDKILVGLPNVCCYLDDILISGKTYELCLERTMQVLERLNYHNVRINQNKCKWFCQEVEYLGQIISKQGRKPSPTKVEAVIKAKAPSNVQEVRSYLGLINHYAVFLPNLSTVVEPLRALLHKDVSFHWSKECQQAFSKTKGLIVSPQVLMHYNPSLPLVVLTDASPVGLGAVLCHEVQLNNKIVERPVLFASCALSPTQQKYAQIDREALAIIFAISKFHKYIFGRKFKLITDNAPLKHILSPNKALPVLAATRLQHWAAILSSYTYDMEHRKAIQLGPADALSRLPLVHYIKVEFNPALLKGVPITAEDIAQATLADPILNKVADITRIGWPNKCDVEIKAYFEVRDHLSLQDGGLLMGNRVVVPLSLQPQVLKLLHVGHPGIVRSKMLARMHFWWPAMTTDIDVMCENCLPCSTFKNATPNQFIPWPKCSFPFERVHIDYYEIPPLKFFIVCDAFSKWLDTKLVDHCTALETINQLSSLFATFGVPRTLVSDNAKAFEAQEFVDFCTSMNVSVLKTPPYHAASNGRAERGVQICKKAIKKMSLESNESINCKIMHFLMAYRNTPSTVTGKTPNQLLLNFQPRSLLTILNPQGNKKVIVPAAFKENDIVQITINKNKMRGIIVRQLSGHRYLVNVQGVFKQPHFNQIKLLPV